MNNEYHWPNLDDYRSVADAALAYANSPSHEGAGYTVRLTLAGWNTIEGPVLYESRDWIVLGPEPAFVAKSAVQAVEIVW